MRVGWGFLCVLVVLRCKHRVYVRVRGGEFTRKNQLYINAKGSANSKHRAILVGPIDTKHDLVCGFTLYVCMWGRWGLDYWLLGGLCLWCHPYGPQMSGMRVTFR